MTSQTVAALCVWIVLCCGVFARGAAAADQPPRVVPLDASAQSFRLYEGVTLLIDNPEGRPFKLSLDVRDLNLTEPCSGDMLFKVYDPAGKAVVREVIPDDGVATLPTETPAGGWGHESWYYLFQYNRGVTPALRWTAFTAPDRLAATPARTFDRDIAPSELAKATKAAAGVYRVVLVGTRDHVVTVRVDPALKWAVGANPFLLHPVGGELKKRFIYIPKGVTGINMAIVENDRPRSRKFTLRDEAGNVVAQGKADTVAGFAEAKPAKPGEWDEKVFSFELGDGPNAYMVQCALILAKMPGNVRPFPMQVPAFFAPDAATAKALRGGAIYHDGQTFWQPAQVRMHEWLKTLKPEDFAVKSADGAEAKEIMIQNPGGRGAGLDLAPNRNAEFIPLNGVHEQAPLSDTIMFSYDLHRNKQALNVAIRDIAGALNTIGPSDHVMNATWKGMANLAYEFGTYRFHTWRSSWRLIQEKDTPAEARELVREMIGNGADRLAFCRSWERVNGNAFTTVLCGLRYAAEGTQDPMNKRLFETFYDRFVNGGFGARTGRGPSGLIQEAFVYDNHYGSYTIATAGSVARDLKDERFIALVDGFRKFYSYTLNPEVAAAPFSGRTNHNPSMQIDTDGPYAFRGLPGPDFTETINNANEFFAARRKGYYVLSYHGRMTPKWMSEGFRGQMGWSGGVLCQFVVPGKGTVLASTIDPPGYGTNMHPSQWRTFRINSIVGVTTDGKPLVASDCEHLNARLEGNKAIGSGEVRDSSVNATRSYTYNADHVLVEAKLRLTDDDASLNSWFKNAFRGCVSEAWEMIPFVANKLAPVKEGDDPKTSVRVLGADGKEAGVLTDALIEGQAIVIDRGGFGVRIELEKPMKVKRGAGDTVMIQLIEGRPMGPLDDKGKPNAEDAAIRYKLVPFGG